MKIPFSTLLSAILIPMLCAGAADDKPLPGDPDLRIGRLDNGLTYYIKHSENPENRADFFIAHNVGALQEDDDQNGLAHLLEHMAFNGSDHFPDGMLDYTSALGVRFGYNVNAFTSHERTVYNISNVPLVRESIVDSLLLLLHDWSGFLTLDPAQIDKERGVIREEWRQGLDVRTRMAEAQAKIEYAGTKYTVRDVIGDPEIIATFPRETLVDFYKKWYRPDMQAIIVVGDVDVDTMEAKIRKVFSTIPAVANPAVKETIELKDAGRPVIATLTDPESSVVTTKLIFKSPFPSPEERKRESSIREDLIHEVSKNLISNRLALVEKPDTAHWRRAVVVTGKLSTLRRTLMITIMPQRDTNMIACFSGVERELERMRRHGFTEQEFADAYRKTRVDTERRTERFMKATNTDIASRLVANFTLDMPLTPPAVEARITRELMQGITYDDIEANFASMLDRGAELVIFTVPEKMTDKVPATEKVVDVFSWLPTAKIDALPKVETIRAPIFPDVAVEPGTIAKSEELPFEGAQRWTLSNGIKVLYKPIAEAKDRMAVHIVAQKPGGYNLSRDYKGMDLLGQYIRVGGSINELSKDELRERLMENRINMTIGLEREQTTISGAGPAEGFETMLQTANRFICAPNFSDQNYQRAMTRIRSVHEQEPSEFERFRDTVNSVRYGDNPWMERASLEDVQQMTPRRLEALYDKLFSNPTNYTFYISAAIPEADAKKLICKYLGSIPAPAQRTTTGEEILETLPGIREVRFTGERSVTPKVEIQRIYHGDFDITPENNAALRYADYILGERFMQSVREEKGGTYYISVKESLRLRGGQKCYLDVEFKTDPALADMLVGEIQEDIEALAADGPTERELEQARLYFEKVWGEKHENDLKTPRIWVDKLITWDQASVDLRADDPEILNKVTTEQVRETTRRLLDQGNRFTSMFVQP